MTFSGTPERRISSASVTQVVSMAAGVVIGVTVMVRLEMLVTLVTDLTVTELIGAGGLEVFAADLIFIEAVAVLRHHLEVLFARAGTPTRIAVAFAVVVAVEGALAALRTLRTPPLPNEPYRVPCAPLRFLDRS